MTGKPLMVIACVALAFGLWAGDAQTWYVDCNLSGFAGHDGKSPESAFETIQEAVDAASAGDTILVQPGRYAKGGGDTVRSDTKASCGNSRVFVEGKANLTIRSLGCKTNTFIVGQAASTSNKLGDDAYRCVAVQNSEGTVVEGFTLCDGSTKDSSTETLGSGGGLFCLDAKVKVYLVDCDIVNCVAYNYSASYYGTLVRCHVHNNISTRGGVYFCRYSRLFCSIVSDNAGTPSGNVLSHCKVVNSTIVGNSVSGTGVDGNATSGCFIYNSIVESSGAFKPAVPQSNNLLATNDYKSVGYYLIAPALGDYRPRLGGGATGAGDPQYRTLFSDVPRDYLKFDFLKQEIPADSTFAGAVHSGVAAVGKGVLLMSEGSPVVDRITYDDRAWDCGGNGSYFFSVGEVKLHKVQVTKKPSAESYLYSVTSGNGTRYPDRSDAIYLMPEPSETFAVITNRLTYTKTVVWADATAAAEGANGTAAHPYPTLQAAIDSSTSQKIVFARPGVYAEGSRECSWGCSSRVCFEGCNARLVSTDGPDKTFIVGDDSLCCVICRAHAQVLGFTLTGGHEATKGNGGGAYQSAGLDLHLTECVITNNHGIRVAAGYGARLFRCLIGNNTNIGSYVCEKSYLSSCIVRDNVCANGVQFDADCRLVTSTVISGAGMEIVAADSSVLRGNNVFFGGSVAASPSSASASGGNVYWGFTTYNDTNGRVGDPELLAVGVRALPYPTLHSSAVGAAVVPTETVLGSAYAQSAWSDFDDCRESAAESGAMRVAGALLTPRKGVTVTVSGDSFVVTGGEAGSRPVDEMSEDLVIAPRPGTRPACGVLVNGETNLFENLPNHVWRLTPQQASASADGITASVLYSSDWYVAADGDDSALGYFPSAPRKLLTTLLDDRVVAADVVHAAPGSYGGAGACLLSGTDTTIPAVAPVGAGVTLIADEGPGVTEIVGSGSEILDVENEWRLGPQAVRCVWLDRGAKVSGFTLRGGRTRSVAGGHYTCDNSGGGVLGPMDKSIDAYVENCVISNCASFRGGAARYVTLVNCRIFGNYAQYNSAIAGESRFFGCIADRNVCPNNPVYEYLSIDNSAFGAENCTAAGAQLLCPSSPNKGASVRNTIALGPVETNKVDRGWYRNCFATKVSSPCEGLTIVDPGELQLGPDYRPVIGASAAIDAGDIDIVPDSCGSGSAYVFDRVHDASGGQRVFNGAMDAGALEADWRETYARDIGRRIVVTDATPSVVEADGNTVRIPCGNRVEASWSGVSSAERLVSVRVTGSGTLTVLLNGEVLGEQTGSGRRDLVFSNSLDANVLSFSYSGADGFAEILRARSNRGNFLILK